jgi:IS5 family transposase
MSGQIVDAPPGGRPASAQHPGGEGRHQGRPGAERLETEPAKLRHKDGDASWTVKCTQAKLREDGTTPAVDLAIPAFGYRNHISIDRGFGFIASG